MLMPTLSVTAIGVVVAVVAMIAGRLPGSALVRAIVGAWVGFVVGALPGVVVDVVLGTGEYLALLGHLGALVGAVVVVAVPWPRRRTHS